MEISDRKLEWPCRPAKTPRCRRRARPTQAQKSPHRPPSHRTSTKPSGGRGVTGAKTPRARQRQEQRKKTMLWRMWVSPMKRKSMLFEDDRTFPSRWMVMENVITVVDVHLPNKIRWTTRLDSSWSCYHWSCYHWGWGGPSVLGLWCHTTKCIEAGETAFGALALTTFLDLSVLQSCHMYCNKGQLFESSKMFNLPLVIFHWCHDFGIHFEHLEHMLQQEMSSEFAWWKVPHISAK